MNWEHLQKTKYLYFEDLEGVIILGEKAIKYN